MSTKLALIALMTATLVAYAPVRSGGFVYEDGVYLSFAGRPLTVEDVLQPRGLTILSFRLNGLLHGLSPQGYHAVNVGLHLLVGLAFFGVARTLLPVPYALVATGLYWLHPINSEGVAYVAGGRAELIAALGVLLAVWSVSRPAVTWTHAGLAFLATTMAIGGKETGLMAIPLIGLYALVIRRVPLLRWRTVGWALLGTLSLAVLALPIIQTRILGASEYLLMTERTPVRYALTQAYAVLVILGNVVWPSGLTVDHDFDVITRAGGWASLGVLLVVLGVTWALRRRQPVVTFGVWWMAIALAPRFLVPQSEYLNEHQIVTACLGLWLASAAGVQWLNAWLTTPRELPCDSSPAVS